MTQHTFSANEFRAHFPHLDSLVHLASCSQGAYAVEAHYALSDMSRSLHLHGAPWGQWMAKVEELRKAFANLINADANNIAIVPSASAGAYQVATAFDWTDASLLTSDLEFPSVGQVFRAQEANGARVESIDDRESALDASVWSERMNDSTKLVSIPLVSYHNGARPDVSGIINAAKSRGAATFIDAYQGAGVVPIDVQELDCDFLVTGALKYMLGLGGVAFLYVRNVEIAEKRPEFTGWFGRRNPFSFDAKDVSVGEGARRYEGGTPSVPAVYASTAGLNLLNKVEQHDAYAYVMDLRRYFNEEVAKLGLEVNQPSDRSLCGPQVAVRVDDPEGVAEALASERVITAPRNDVLRMALHYYSTVSDVDRAVAALRKHARK